MPWNPKTTEEIEADIDAVFDQMINPFSTYPNCRCRPVPVARKRVELSECERAALALVVAKPPHLGGVDVETRKTLISLLGRSAPKRPNVRYVVKCKSRFAGRVWEKVYFDKLAAQAYARHAVESWCDRKDVRIVKQKWITF